MDNSNRDRTPARLGGVAARLRRHRATATPLELDRIKLQAMRQGTRSRPSLYERKKGMLMKSRLALVMMLAVGLIFSTTGATLAITGSSGSGNAAQSQYQDVLPAETEGGGGDGNGEAGEVLGANGGNGNDGATVSAPASEQIAVADDSGSLPFTGFLAIPLLVIGVGLMSLGAILHRQAGRLNRGSRS